MTRRPIRLVSILIIISMLCVASPVFATDSTQYLYVVDGSAKVVHKLTLDGQYLKAIGQGVLNDPRDCAIDVQGNLIVADYTDYKVFRNETYLTSFGADLFPDCASLITVDSTGKIYAGRRAKGLIHVYDANYQFLTTYDYRSQLGGSYEGPSGLSFDPTSGNLIFSTFWASSGTDHGNYEIATNGTIVREFGPGWYSMYYSLPLKDGRILVLDHTSGIVGYRVYGTDRNQIKIWLQGKLWGASRPAQDQSGKIYTKLATEGVISVFDSTDTETSSLTISNPAIQTCSAIAIGNAQAITPPFFVPYPNNPVYPRGVSRVVKYGNEYRLFYVDTSKSYNLNLATSSDGITWNAPNYSVLGPSQTGHTFNYTVGEIKEGGTYKAWSTGTSASCIQGTRLYYSTSTNGTSFTGQGMVLDIEPYPGYDSRNINDPWVVYANGTYHLYYTAVVGQLSVCLPQHRDLDTVAYATSTDGINWTKHGPVLDSGADGAFDSYAVSNPVVIHDGTRFEMFYFGLDGTNRGVGYAVSLNGQTWTKVGKIESLGDALVRGAVKENGTYKVWYYDYTNADTRYAEATGGLVEKIVFVSERSGNQDIWMMNPDGSNQVQLTTDPAADQDPMISPDGTRIAFASNRNGQYQIFVMNVDGSNPTALTATDRSRSHPVWSPDGSKIYYTDGTGTVSVRVMDSSGANQQEIVPGGRFCLSPDGTKIAYLPPANSDPNSYHLFIANADGTNPVNIGAAAGLNGYEAVQNVKAYGSGGKILIRAQEPTWHNTTDYDIYWVKADGNSYGVVLDEADKDNGNAGWSPDETQIVFASQRSGNWDIWVMDAGGTNLRQLTTATASDHTPHWGKIAGAASANQNPSVPSAPAIADQATNVATDAALSWTGGDPNPGDTVTYDVYFGTDPNPPLVSSAQSASTYSPQAMAYSQTYYWKIVATDTAGAVTTGPVWSFTTESAPSGSVYEQALALLPNAKIVLAVETGNAIDTAAIVQNAAYNATMQGGFAVYEKALNSYTFGANCDSDDYPDDSWPAGVTLRFLVLPTGQIFVGASGSDEDVLAVLLSRHDGRSAFYNDPNLVYHNFLVADQRANYLAILAEDQLFQRFQADGYMSGPIQNTDQYWTQATFDIYSAFAKPVFQVFGALIHQQGDFAGYSPSVLDQRKREAWSPATTRDANMTFGRTMQFAYSGVTASALSTWAGADNGNNGEVFLDGASTGKQISCGFIGRLFQGVQPAEVRLAAYTQWSFIQVHYSGTFLADSLTATAHSETYNGVTNPATSYDGNPAPFIFVVNPGWKMHGADPTNQVPEVPSAPSPVSGSSGTGITAVLSWTGGDPDVGDTVTYDVYFGTASNPPLVSSSQSAMTYSPSPMAYSQTYYWKVVAHDDHGGTSSGPVWSFSTGAAPTGTIQVSTNLQGASFSISGPAAYNGAGTVWSTDNAPIGPYTIVYNAISGWQAPVSQSLTLNAGSSIVFSGNYVDDEAPGPPGNPQATPPPNIWTNDGTIDVSWNPGTDNGGGVAGYSFLWDTHANTEPDSSVETTGLSATSGPLSEGADHFFHVRTIDSAGNASATVHVGPFKIDKTAPSSATVAINGGDATTGSSAVTLAVQAVDNGSGVASVKLSNDGVSWSAALPFGPTLNWNLASGQGTQTVYVQFGDAAGNWSAAVSDTIEVVSLPPDPTGLTVKSAINGQVTLEWNPGSTVNRTLVTYGVYRSETQNGFYYRVDTETIDGINFTSSIPALWRVGYVDRRVANGKTYHYKVRAFYGQTASAGFSETVAATVKSTFNFEVKAIDAPSKLIAKGDTIDYQILITRKQGFQGTIDVRCSGLGAGGLSYTMQTPLLSGTSLDNLSLTDPLTVILKVTAGSSATAGDHSFALSVTNEWTGGASDDFVLPLGATVVDGFGLHVEVDKSDPNASGIVTIARGEPVKIYGALNPPNLSGKTVTLTLTDLIHQTTMSKTVVSQTGGLFQDNDWIATLPIGTYELKASFLNSGVPYVSAPRYLDIQKGQARLTCLRDPQAEPQVGQDFAVFGDLAPALSYTGIRIRLFGPDGLAAPEDKTVYTNQFSHYSHTKPWFDSRGIWKFKAYWEGNEDYIGAESDLLIVPVDMDFGRAIILGGGKASSDTSWPITVKLCTDAYRDFRKKGFDDEAIWFMINTDTIALDNDGINDGHVVDDQRPTPSDFLDAIRNRFADPVNGVNATTPLFIYMQGHGKDSGEFVVYGAGSDSYQEVVTAGEIAAALDDLQGATNCTVVLILESCYSGQFIDALRGSRRIIITSSGNELYAPDKDGVLAFSRYLFSRLTSNQTLYDSFLLAQQDARSFILGAPSAMLEDDGQQPANSFNDGFAARQIILNPTFGLRPIIGSIVTDTLLDDGSTTSPIAVEVIRGDRDTRRVWAKIIPPGNVALDAFGNAVYPEVSLALNTQTGKYEGTINGLARNGVFQIIVMAEDVDFTVSDPQVAYISVSGFVTGDVTGDGLVTLADAISALKAATGAATAGITTAGDVNGDGRIGLAEAVYAIQKVAGMR